MRLFLILALLCVPVFAQTATVVFNPDPVREDGNVNAYITNPPSLGEPFSVFVAFYWIDHNELMHMNELEYSFTGIPAVASSIDFVAPAAPQSAEIWWIEVEYVYLDPKEEVFGIVAYE